MSKDNTILIVDDEFVMLDLLGTLLKKNGYSVMKAHSGEEVLEMLSGEFLPGKVITDLNMLGVSGNDVGRAIKAYNSSFRSSCVTLQVLVFAMKKCQSRNFLMAS